VSAAPSKPATPQARCVIIGPASCGKTSLLSTLKIATDQIQPGPTQYTVLTRHARTLKFFTALSEAILTTGRIDFPGTTELIDHQFTLEQVSRGGFFGLFGNNRSRYEFRSSDTAGRTVLPLPGESESVDPTKLAEIVAESRVSDGLILLVDAADRTTAGTFFVSLLPFLANAADDSGRVNFRRVAIVLTKADTLVAHYGASAHAELERLDPWRYALDSAIGIIPIRQLLQYLRPEHRRSVYCGWASVYGFIPQDGAVNVMADEDGDRLAVFNAHDASWVNRWHPYQVLDPFVYTATGNPMGLKPLPPDLTRGL
jgi:GTPase SAR1 family protein